MGFRDFFLGGFSTKSAVSIQPRPLGEIELAVENGLSGIGSYTDENALKATVVLCITRVIADGIAQVPFKLMKKSPTGGRGEDATEHPLYNLLRYEPNEWQTSYEFREQAAFHLVGTGNSFVYINRDLRGNPTELYAFKPESVTVTQNDDFSISYRVATGTHSFVDLPASDVWHIKGPSWDGIVGLNISEIAQQAIGLAIASETFGAKLFSNAARPGGILSSDANLTKDQRDELRRAWQEQQGGLRNAHGTAVLGGGMKFQSISSSANDAQWTESRRFQIEEICRAFRVQPIMVMQQGATSYASVEQLMLAHLQNCLLPWYERIEQSARKALLTNADKQAGYYVKLDGRALLEASNTDRLAYYNAGRTQGWLTINDVRDKEDLKRFDDPLADKPMPAANLFGQQEEPALPEANNNNDNQDATNGNVN